MTAAIGRLAALASSALSEQGLRPRPRIRFGPRVQFGAGVGHRDAVAVGWPGTDVDPAPRQAAAGREPPRGHQHTVARRGARDVATDLELTAEIDGAVRADRAEGARAAAVPRPSPAGSTAVSRPRMGADSAAEAVTMARLETTVELWTGAGARAALSAVTGRDTSGSTSGTGPGLRPRPGRPPGDVDDAWDEPAAPAEVPPGALPRPVAGPKLPGQRRRRPGLGTEPGGTARGQAAEPEVTVQVSIGRIEVRLADTGRDRGGRAGQDRTRPGLLSLEDYSVRRGGRR